MPNKQRNFKFIDEKDGKSSGRYRSYTPRQAARKCASKRFEINKRNGNTTQPFNIIIRETTRGSKRKCFAYYATCQTLRFPVNVRLGNKMVTFKRRTIVKKMRLPRICATMK